MTHTIKIVKCFADAIVRGEKTFEVRFNADRGFQKGDRVVFWVPKFDDEKHCSDTHDPISQREYEITYVVSGYGLKEGYVAFGIKEVEAG